jgi:hypothetical protein
MYKVTWVVSMDGEVISVGTRRFPHQFGASAFSYELRKYLDVLNILRSCWRVINEFNGEQEYFEGVTCHTQNG